ncbi:MAG TPA: Gfo/Idh/MocA family oxidoreductase [Bryobacteraceae bacterium]|nr:Gfo/Idh/MocA family oxidoreductase [Bryobacteraceae bacterium]
MNISRRDLASGAGLTALSYSRILGANDRVRMGYIGLGNRGAQVHDAFLEFGDAETVAICDLRQDYLDFAAKKSRGTPKQYPDYRTLIEDKNIDAVVIATPDHWHALMMIDACNAGKDVYVEKPLSLTVFEGRRMVEAAERTRRVVQVGTQRRSSKMTADAVDYVRSGALGQVTVARCYDIQNEWPNGIGNFPDEAPPTDEQWDRWLGPAPKIPYNRNRAYYKFRWFYNYSGGQLTNFGVHLVDTLRRCLQLESPKKVTAIGGHWAIKDNREIPDTLEVLWEYDGPTLITFTQINGNAAPGNLQGSEMELRGTKGTMYIHESRWEVVPERITDTTKPANTPLDRTLGRAYSSTKKPLIGGIGGKGNAYADIEHARNFLDCVKSRAKCNADILTGHVSTSATLIANIAHKTENLLRWDAKAERFTNNQAANRFLHYQYRAPYKLG